MSPEFVVESVERIERASGGEVTIHIRVRDQGQGPLVVLLPSLGRDSDEFDPLAAQIAAAGYRVLRPIPRGIGGSTGPLSGLTLHELAADVLAVIASRESGPAFIAGHAFGNWIARVAATDRPDLVRAVLVLAAGPRKIGTEVTRGLEMCMDLSLPDAERLHWLQRTFFAPGNDASVWLHGWHPEVSACQRAAKAATPIETWWDAGGVPMLDVWAENDAFAPAADGWRLQHDLGEQVTSVGIAHAGHALIPEQPMAVANAVLGYLRSFEA